MRRKDHFRLMKLHTQDRYRLRGSDKAAGGANSVDHMFDHMTVSVKDP